MSKNWSDMSNDQLQGAECAFELMRVCLSSLGDTHPDDGTITAVLKFTEENRLEILREMNTRPALLKDKSRIFT